MKKRWEVKEELTTVAAPKSQIQFKAWICRFRARAESHGHPKLEKTSVKRRHRNPKCYRTLSCKRFQHPQGFPTNGSEYWKQCLPSFKLQAHYVSEGNEKEDKLKFHIFSIHIKFYRSFCKKKNMIKEKQKTNIY